MFPACHISKWPAALLDNGDRNDIEDFAPEPGLSQSFPVVTPFSTAKRGPQDTRPPREVLAKIVEKEERNDAWAFRRDRAKAALLREQAVNAGLKHKAGKASRDAEIVATYESERLEEVNKAIEERQRRGQEELRSMLSRLQEACDRKDEMEQQCRQCVAEGEELLTNERRHTGEVQTLLDKERERTAEAHLRVEAEEHQSRMRVKTRDAALEAARLEAAHLVGRAQQEAEARVQDVRQRCDAELVELRKQLAEAKEQCRGRTVLQEQQRLNAEQRVANRRCQASVRETTDTETVRRHVNSVRDDGESLVSRLQRREDQTTESVSRTTQAMAPLFDAAVQKSMEAHQREMRSNLSLQHAVHILGGHVASQRQYGDALDDRVSTVLQGCLHGRAPPAASPSARCLPPPQHPPQSVEVPCS